MTEIIEYKINFKKQLENKKKYNISKRKAKRKKKKNEKNIEELRM